MKYLSDYTYSGYKYIYKINRNTKIVLLFNSKNKEPKQNKSTFLFRRTVIEQYK